MPLIMATFVVPNILMVLLIATPFIDRGPERRIQKRPFALFSGIAVIAFLAYMTVKGSEAPAGTASATLPLSGLESDPTAQAGVGAVPGRGVFELPHDQGRGGPRTRSGPHQRRAQGSPLTPDTAKQFLTNPPAGMLAFPSFTAEQYTEIGTFIDGLGTEYK